MSDDEHEDEPLDPRIETALLSLNHASDEINDSEAKYEATKKAFTDEMERMKGDIRVLKRKIGQKVLAQARPYYDASFVAYRAQMEVKRASEYFENAYQFLKDAKAVVREIEKRLENGAKFDEALQHELNTAYEATTSGEAKLAKIDAYHVQKMKAYRDASEQVKALQKTKKKVIAKSRIYFQRKLEHDKALQVLRDRLLFLARSSVVARNNYSSALKTLEKISSEIHQKRLEAQSGKAAALENLPSPVAEAKLTERIAAADATLANLSTDREAEARNMVSQISTIDESADDDTGDHDTDHASDDESLSSEAELTNFIAEYAHMRSVQEGSALVSVPEFDESAFDAAVSPSVQSPTSALTAPSGLVSPTSPNRALSPLGRTVSSAGSTGTSSPTKQLSSGPTASGNK